MATPAMTVGGSREELLNRLANLVSILGQIKLHLSTLSSDEVAARSLLEDEIRGLRAEFVEIRTALESQAR